MLTTLTERHPDDADLWLELSYANRLCGSDDAADHAAKANELAPTASRTHGELALALSEYPQRLDEAIGVIEQGIALDDGEALNWAVLGTLRLAADEPVGASLACERALAIDPECVEAHFVLGDAAVAFGALDEAAERYRHVFELAPELDAVAAALEWVAHQLPSTQTAANPASTAADEASEPSPIHIDAYKPSRHRLAAPRVLGGCGAEDGERAHRGCGGAPRPVRWRVRRAGAHGVGPSEHNRRERLGSVRAHRGILDDNGEYASEFVGLYTVLAGRIVRARLYYDSGCSRRSSILTVRARTRQTSNGQTAVSARR